MTFVQEGVPPNVKNLPKRTRLNVRQSKNGCFTCKARRIKCDEGLPTCARCKRSGKHCEGYKSREASSDSDRSTPSTLIQTPYHESLVFDISFDRGCGIVPSSEGQSYARLGLEILLQEPMEQVVWSKQPPWIRLLSQCVHTNAALNQAVALFGMIYQSRCIPDSSVPPKLLPYRTQKAIATLQTEIEVMQDGPVPLFFATVMLAAAEVLQRAFISALTHLGGAYSLLSIAFPRSQSSLGTDSAVTASVFAPGHQNADFGNVIHDFALSIDLQTAWYALSRPPMLPNSYDHFTPTSTQSIDDSTGPYSERVTLSLLHSCYHFAVQARDYKYRPRSETPPSLLLEQSHLIAALSTWIAENDISEAKQHDGWQPSSQKLLTHRVQCLSTLIYLSTLLSPYEMAYDAHGTHFQEIIELSSKTVIATSQRSNPYYSTLKLFKLTPGIFQPLWLTALKYRDPFHRRRAVHLLSQLNLEGPWDPHIMSAIAQRAIEIEEGSSEVILETPGGSRLVSELNRIHGCGVDSTPRDDKGRCTVEAHFSLCKDVKHMLQSKESDGPAHWTLWSENISVPYED